MEIIIKMEQPPVNQRLNFLADSLAESVRAFGLAIGDNSSNAHKYIKGSTRPSPDFLEKVLSRFGNINARWLMTGEGEPFLSDPQTGVTQTGNFNQAGNSNKQTIKGTKGEVQANSGGTNTINNTVELNNCQRDLAAAQKENELLRQQLTMAQALLEAKEETLSLLRAGHNRLN